MYPREEGKNFLELLGSAMISQAEDAPLLSSRQATPLKDEFTTRWILHGSPVDT